MKRKHLSTKQTIIACVGFLAFLIFAFFHLPGQNTLSRVKSESLKIEAQIQGIEAMIGKGESMAAGMQFLIERYQELNNQFPQKEEESIRMLSRLSRELNIKLISLKPQPKVVFLDQNKQAVEIEGKTCQKVYVSLEMKCFYKDLVKYITSLKRDLPAFVTVEKLRISKSTSATPRLNVILDINLYFLS